MKKRLADKFILKLISLYRGFISPWFFPSCRFTPSCSLYAIESINKYGIFSSLRPIMGRVLSCNPFNKKSGFDPVP